ncbi:hypothetical protein LMH87_011727 [Akanthomyces muscarius]|uniref:protein S-acyltransferase n=1 Tax=Akanthomyces muscarius TaxID=2231603 RepID=A0A9W8QB74_AKAMU|nr:hypothetical protein LMH87_011727 [Akanthomyces muscarius]KAJ4151006.1 hypothetical protein LMH87_011727 [Akanthomyces muscarius]
MIGEDFWKDCLTATHMPRCCFSFLPYATHWSVMDRVSLTTSAVGLVAFATRVYPSSVTRDVKSSLNIMLGASNSDDMLKIWLDIQDISSVTDQASQGQVVMNDKVLMALAGVDERIAQVEQMLQNQSELIRMNQFVQVQSAYGMSPLRKATESSGQPYSSFHSGEKTSIGIRVTPSAISCPDDAQCINFAISGNITGLQHLFNSGLASARDISTTRGYSLLRWALYSKHPRIKACHFLLEGNLPDQAVEALRAITKGSEYLDDFIDDSSFTQTHRIVLGLSTRDLEEELLINAHEINAQDSMGRTAMAWAAARNDRHAIVTLLRYCADPNIIDVQISGPLSNAAAQGHTACVKLLLDAGARPDLPLPRGIIKDGKTALFHAAQKDDASLAILLLENGAVINLASKTGDTPLTTAITHNSHNVLRLFLERWHEYSICPRLKGPHILKITALYADIETMGILANTDHSRLKYDKKYALGDLTQVLRTREDATNKLAFVFDELLQLFQGPPPSFLNVEDSLEAGNLCHSFSRVATWETILSSDEVNDEHRSDADSEECFIDALTDLRQQD